MKIIAITGGIACGKSFCRTLFEKRGIKSINADEISHNISQNSTIAKEAIKNNFGQEFFNEDGSLNRKSLGKLVFNDIEALNKLNRIMHPLIQQEIERQIENYKKQGEKLIALEIPLLYESGMENLANEVICCYTNRDLQINRLVGRDGLSPMEAEKRIDSQMPLEFKLKKAKYAIDTSVSFEDTESQLNAIIDKLIK